jgi:hypothetical protein
MLSAKEERSRDTQFREFENKKRKGTSCPRHEQNDKKSGNMES